MELNAKKRVLKPLEKAKEPKILPDKSLSISNLISIDIEDEGAMP